MVTRETVDVEVLAVKVASVDTTLREHLTACAEANKKLGERVWQICIIICGALGSLGVGLVLQGQHTQDTAREQASSQTASIIQAIDQLKK